jgi:acetoin utilization deacetylase AcuC-like enzyme
MTYDHPNLDVKYDSDNDVKKLFDSAKRRRESKLKYKLISDLLEGKTINVTSNTELFESLNRERLELEQIMSLHPEEVKNCLEYVKDRKVEQNGTWWNKDSEAKHGEWGAIPECVYYARPQSYWNNLTLKKNFFNQFSKFRISEKPL